MTGALDGTRVVEFGWAAAGPLVGTHLAQHGADVIQSNRRPPRSIPPTYRRSRPSRRTGSRGDVRFYNAGSAESRSISSSAGVELALRSYGPRCRHRELPAGTLARRGLGHDALRRARQDLVILSSCNQGQTGPHAQHPGYGSQLTALAGFNELLGEPGRTPVILYGPYIDYVAVGYGVIAVLAALERRRRTGEGCVVDLSQYEAGLQFLAPALLEHAANGTVPTRDANHDRVAVPHGVYPASGVPVGRPLGLEQRRRRASARRSAIPRGHVTPILRVRTAAGARAELEPHRRVDGHGRARRSSRPSQPRPARRAVESIGELFDDPQLAHRGVWRRAPHPGLGEVGLMAPPFALSETPARPDRAGPTLGEHNEAVFKGLLGLGADEYASLAADGVFA